MERNAERRTCAARLVALACLLLLGCGAAFGQEAAAPAAADQAQEFTVTDLLRLPGRVVAQGSNTTSKVVAKGISLRSYRVEEVTLPHIAEVEVQGQRIPVTKAFRVTLTGGPFPVRALPAVIWLDDVAIGYGIENEDLSEITVVTYDASMLRNGASIYLSYGNKEQKKDRTALAEKLKLATKGVQP
ncbi:MAG TPA: hypothetical protein VE775_07645 [Pyrinomonadaceae bacterium]|nr:hypothetical protein [Pyrinomonadaceae bacterium]